MPGAPWVPHFIADLQDNVGLSTDGAFTSNSDALIPTQKAVKTYVAANGGASDMFSALSAAEISVTGAVTATLDRSHVCSGTTADYAVTLPALSAGKVIGFRMAAGLTKLVTLTTGADAVTKTGTLTGGSGANATGSGTVGTSGSSTALTGVSTSFTTQLRVGDTLYMRGTGAVVRVTAIAGDTSLTMSSAVTVTPGTTFYYTSTGLVGSSTVFTTDYAVGNGITVNGVTRQVVSIASNTSMVVDAPFPTAPSGATHGMTTTTIDGAYNRIMWAGEAATLLCDGSNWTKIAGKSIPMLAGIWKSTGQLFSSGTDTKILCDAAMFTPSVAAMHNLATNSVIAQRPGNYLTTCSIQYDSSNTSATRIISRVQDATAATVVGNGVSYRPASGSGYAAVIGLVASLSRNQALVLGGYFDTGSFTTTTIVTLNSSATFFSISEIPSW